MNAHTFPSHSTMLRYPLLLITAMLFAGCGAGKTTQSAEGRTKTVPPAAPAPGTASILGDIVDCEAEAAPITCNVTVTKVLAYGSGTPQLPPGTAITVSIRDASRLSEEFLSAEGAPKAGSFRMLVYADNPPGSQRSWRLMSLHQADA